eukprot:CAMPEP_0170828360 /NCGR_PEP_ID=MMETSP0733-20121128/47872_1 /TAXON_ID=186038 /ORGANISM="Fragilariopsis kerguelensis, Strain L26-C5" /LENGTH=101 /DNA_ID=CAMNT_0011192823 /DNA_START=308 /DNA_END=613 /DNA_ORIENTATION=-
MAAMFLFEEPEDVVWILRADAFSLPSSETLDTGQVTTDMLLINDSLLVCSFFDLDVCLFLLLFLVRKLLILTMVPLTSAAFVLDLSINSSSSIQDRSESDR